MMFAALAFIFGVIAHRIIFTDLPEESRVNPTRSQDRTDVAGMSLTEVLGTYRFC
jgi:hypothetical protein